MKTGPALRSCGLTRAGGLFLAVLASFFLIRPASAQSHAPAISVGQNVMVSSMDQDRVHDEVQIGAKPGQPSVLTACSMASGLGAENQMDVSYVSVDNGRSWRLIEHTPLGQRFLDPVCLFTPRSRLFMALGGGLTTERVPSVLGRGVWTYRATHAASAANGVKIISTGQGFFDRPFVAVDQSGPRFPQRVYLGGLFSSVAANDPLKPIGLRVGLWYSTDDAQNFEGPATLNLNTGDVIPGSIAVSSRETVLMTFGVARGSNNYDSNSSPARAQQLDQYDVVVSASHDGGKTLEPPVKVATMQLDEYQVEVYHCGCLPAIVADTTTGPHRGRVYVTWTQYSQGFSEPMLAFSDDDGKTWSKPSHLSDESHRDSVQSAIAVNGDGLLGAVWQSEQNEPLKFGYEERFAVSYDGGVTFSPSVLVSTSAQNVLRLNRRLVVNRIDTVSGAARNSARLNVAESAWPAGGDTDGIDADSLGRFHVVWVDNRTGTDQVWTSTISVGRPVEDNRTDAQEIPEVQDQESKTASTVARSKQNQPNNIADGTDVTEKFRVVTEGGTLDSASGILRIIVAITPRGSEELLGPITLRIVHAQSPHDRNIEVLTPEVAVSSAFQPNAVVRIPLEFRIHAFTLPRTLSEMSSILQFDIRINTNPDSGSAVNKPRLRQ